MMYLYCLLFGFTLPFGQTLWKVALTKHPVGSDGLFALILSWQFILGGFIYVAATAFYLYILNKYPYSVVQPLVVSLSLIASVSFARFYFKETISPINLLGMLIIITGIILVTKK